MCPVQLCRLPGRLREQARSHSLIVGYQVDMHRLAGRLRRQASSHIWIAGRQASPTAMPPLTPGTWQSPTDIAPASLPSGTAAYYNAKSVESELEGGNPPQETWGSATPTGITHLPAHLLQARSFLRGHR